jgi:heme/copper-type cytochrome/quinol oxidase subunit 2
MNRSILNIIIDTLAAAIMLGMIATGIIVRFTLPPGSGRALGVWGLTRHQWGDLHFWLALAAVATVVLHLALHWMWVVSVVRRSIVGANHGLPSARLRAVAAVATVLIACSAVAGFWWSSIQSIYRTDTTQPQTAEHRPDGAGIRGNMTLAETAAALGWSVEQVRQRLDLPTSVKDSEHLGQIAKERETTMQEMRKRLEPQSPEPKP